MAESPPTEIDAVAALALVQRGDDPAEDRERHDEHEGDERELGRVLSAVPSRSLTGLPESIGVAEVARQDAADPVEVLRRGAGGSVPSSSFSVVDRLLVGERARGCARPTLPGQHLRAEEDDEAQEPERDEPEPEPPEMKRAMRERPGLGRRAAARRPG